ncbi:MAG: ATP synthase subunit I [Desulfobulbaceae bacterium]|uniref:ATP synthase subunit I n=1 Tax=Candidatus Desulfobia pelagia TaxID=2841692 RepID=A0A8J6N8J8_9BACT|nr:ATP synthase subunit I [Candidatus Desulfobia pelagia]
MIDLIYLYGFLLGVITGLYYFFGLWLTVKKVPSSANPKRLLALSFIARLLPTLIIMLIAARQNPGLFLTLLPGFFLVRFVMTRKIGRCKEPLHAAQS